MPYEFLEEELPQQEGTLGLIGRTGGRLLARAGETLAGTPGELANLPATLSNLLVHKVMGQLPQPLPQKLGEGVPQGPLTGTTAEKFLSAFEEEPTGAFGLPTTQEVRERVTKPLTGEYLEPRNEAEKIGDEAIADLTSLLMPAAFGKKVVTFSRALGAVGTGNIAKWLTKKIGGGEVAQTGAKLGTMILTSAVNPGGLQRYMKNLYASSRDIAPDNVFVKSNILKPTVEKLGKIKQYGLTTPTKTLLNETYKELSEKVKKQSISIKDLVESKYDLNELVSQRGITETAKHHYNELKKDILDVLKKESIKNPSLEKIVTPLFKADEIYKAINQSSKLKSFLNKHISLEKLYSPATAVLLGLHPKGSMGGIGAGLGIRESVNFIEPILRSGEVRKYYLGALTAATKNNAAAAINNVKRLDKELAKKSEQPKSQEKWELI